MFKWIVKVLFNMYQIGMDSMSCVGDLADSGSLYIADPKCYPVTCSKFV